MQFSLSNKSYSSSNTDTARHFISIIIQILNFQGYDVEKLCRMNLDFSLSKLDV